MYNSPAAHLNRHYTTNKYTEYISSKSNLPTTLKRVSSSELEQYDPDHTTNSNNPNCMNNVSKILTPTGLDSTLLSKKTKYSSHNSNSSGKPQANWLRIVKFDAINSSSFESASSSQFKKIVYKAHNQHDTDLTNSLPQPIWHRTVKCVASETSSDKTGFPLLSEKARHVTGHVIYDQYSTPTDVFTSRGHHNNFSQVMNIPKVVSQNKSISSTLISDRPSDIIQTLSRPTSHLMENLPMTSNTPVSAHSELSRIFNSTLVQPSDSSNIVYSNHAQIIIDLDDFTSDENQLQPNINANHHLETLNQENQVARNIPLAQSISSSANTTNSETLEVVIRSRNNADFNVMVNNPDIIRMHKILQRHLSIPGNLNMSTSNPNLFYHVNNYMQVLRSTIFSTDQNNSDIMSILNTSLPQLLTFDQASYTLIDKSSIMPPVNTVHRFQKGHAVTSLANCAICLEENVGNVLLKPCNHYDMCGRCMENLKKWICPICRSPISNIIVYV